MSSQQQDSGRMGRLHHITKPGMQAASWMRVRFGAAGAVSYRILQRPGDAWPLALPDAWLKQVVYLTA